MKEGLSVTYLPKPGEENGETPLVEVDHLKLFFPIKDGILFEREVARVHAVNDVTFSIKEGETLGLVGESGCGKTTMSRAIMRLIDSTDGTIKFHGQDVTKASRREMQPLRRQMQMVFQDPFASLNPRRRVGQIVGAPLRLHGTPRGEVEPKVKELLERVGLHPEHLHRYPHEFSGGQRQRIGVARALALQPRLIVLDEPVSALDVSVQAQIINLLGDLQDDLKLTYLFVAHDLSVVRHVSDRHRGDVPREADGGLAGGGAVHEADPSVHGRAAGGDPDPGPGGEPPPRAGGRVGRAAQPDRPALGLRISSPLSSRHGRLPRDRAAVGALSQRPSRGVPPPHERERRRDPCRRAARLEPTGLRRHACRSPLGRSAPADLPIRATLRPRRARPPFPSRCVNAGAAMPLPKRNSPV